MAGRGGMGGSIDVDSKTSRPHGRSSNSRKESSEGINEGTRDLQSKNEKSSSLFKRTHLLLKEFSKKVKKGKMLRNRRILTVWPLVWQGAVGAR